MAIRLLTNFRHLESIIERLESKYGSQTSIELVPATGLLRAVRTCYKMIKTHILLLNVEEALLLRLCLFKYIFPFNPCLILSVDLILRAPTNAKQRLACRLKGLLLKKVDLFILYHKDVSGYLKYFGINPTKCFYVPFKINHFREIQEWLSEQNESSDPADGKYVIAAGRSMRDLKTYIDAMAQTKLPGILLRQDKKILAENGTYLENGRLPSNLKEIVDHGGENSFIDYMRKARIIVIPRFKRDINATGIGTYLMAMAMGKCVIISHGPGATELLKNGEAILVPPEDSDYLAEAIQKAWQEADFRRKIASNGQRYALSLKDERRLLEDMMHASLDLLTSRIECAK